MPRSEKQADPRAQLVEVCRQMNATGLSQGTSGNASVRSPRGLWITPSGVPYARMEASDVVEIDLDGHLIAGDLEPSSEWRMHAAVLQERPELRALVHAHPRHATALACLRRDIPPFHYMVAVAGGTSIRCAPYATFGTVELARHVLTALEDRRACLMANHGVLAAGGSLRAALDLATEVEALAAQYLLALAVGEPTRLSPEEMREVLARFATYGERAEGQR